jgi:hypothetical protein
VPRYFPTLELLESRNLPSATVIALDSSGAGSQTGTISIDHETLDFSVTAPVSGRVSVLMHGENQSLLSLLSVGGATVIDSAIFASTFQNFDNVVQFQATAGQTYQLTATGIIQHLGSPQQYELIIATQTAAFSSAIVHPISLDASGLGVVLGTLETPGEVDTFSFTVPVTGQTTVRIDGGRTGQVTQFLTTPGQSFEVQVSDPGTTSQQPSLYVLTITTIADAILDSVVHPIALDPTGSGTQSGAISYAGDTDTFRFTAPVSGIMTLKMHSVSTLQSQVSVTPATLTNDLEPANDRILQFQVVQGQQYTVRVSGANGSSGGYQLSFAMAVDSDSATTPQVINLDSSGTGSQSGSIVMPGDQDLYQFTAQSDGYVIVAMNSTEGTNLQGLVTFPSVTPVLQTFAVVGSQLSTRDDFVAIQVTKGQTYRFLVSGDSHSIGDYTLALSSYAPGTRATFQTFNVTFDFSRNPPVLSEGPTGPGDLGGTPSAETPPFISTSNTRLAVFSLSSSSSTSSSSGNSTSTTVTVPSSQSVSAPTNSLIATLLTVAARDNAIQSTDSAVASALPSNLSSAVTTSLLVSLVAGSSGGGDMGTVTVIAGSVFEDRNGNGRLDAGEPGVAGDTIILEMRKGDQYVVVGKVSTDASGAFAFAGMPAGDYRVRYLGAGANLTTPAGYPVKVTGNGAVKAIHFGKSIKRGQKQAPHHHPEEDLAHVPETSFPEAVDRVFVDWREDSVPVVLDKCDGGSKGWWLGLFALLPAAMWQYGLLDDHGARHHRRHPVPSGA